MHGSAGADALEAGVVAPVYKDSRLKNYDRRNDGSDLKNTEHECPGYKHTRQDGSVFKSTWHDCSVYKDSRHDRSGFKNSRLKNYERRNDGPILKCPVYKHSRRDDSGFKSIRRTCGGLKATGSAATGGRRT